MNTITLRDILTSIAELPLFHNAGFYFGLFGLIVTFAPRFGFTFTQAEIGQVTVFLGLVFGVAPASVQYMQVKLYESRVKAQEKALANTPRVKA